MESLPTSGVTTFLYALCKKIPSKHLPSQELLKNLALSFAEKFDELILRIEYELLTVSSEKNPQILKKKTEEKGKILILCRDNILIIIVTKKIKPF